MAFSQFPLNYYSPSFSCSPSPSLSFRLFHPQTHSSNSFRVLKFRVSCSQQTVQLDTPQDNSTKKKRKPKPSFFDQIRDKWSMKTPSLREKLPWQEKEQQSEPIECEEEGQSHQSFGVTVTESETGKDPSVSDRLSLVPSNRIVSAPWIHGSKTNKSQFGFVSRNLQGRCENDKMIDGFHRHCEDNVSSNVVQESKNLEIEVNFDGKSKSKGVAETDETPIGLTEKKVTLPVGEIKRPSFNGKSFSFDREVHSFEVSSDKIDSMRLPWERKSDLGSVDGDRLRQRNTILAEKLIPETELKRLRNVALRMVERIKVGAAGVTQALVDSIHEKWKEDEVVKLKFEGPPTLNMKRIHETLESRTGGLVIWRSGSSVVLYRGMTYKLPCVESYTKQNQVNTKSSHSSKDIVGDLPQRIGLKDSVRTAESLFSNSTRCLKDLSEEEIMGLSELSHLLDELGPRFKDWSGREPLPVDADLLPSVVPGYKSPFRLLPYGTRHGLKDKEMTFYRRTARTMPPHFALGRSRELQGLAMAMVKLWERSAIAKIAIKRGVQNTCNERMAEELKILTGGTLLSRNKDYIVFYRGNDFLPPVVTKTLDEAQKLAALQQDEEEQARLKASTLIHSNTKADNGLLVAGTLAETMAATSQWGNQPSSHDIDKMKRDSALSRHASLVRYLEKKLILAKGKIKKAEKALEKVQESLKPAELPTDLETISDEERLLFRRIGLSMKPFLLLGRRGMFDGTIENIHLHWKYRELVKIIVERKSFLQVKHIAISLEAESGGVLVSLDKTTKGYLIILYRGKNYQRPRAVRPRNLLTRRQALARSIELQRREALKYHIADLTERIEKLKSELVCKRTGHEAGFKGATYIDCPMKPCFLCKMPGHTTMTCPHRIATEYGVIPAARRNTHSSLDYVFERQLRPNVPTIKPAFVIPDQVNCAVIRYHSRRVTCLEFHPTHNNILLSGDKKGQLGVWDFGKVHEKIVYGNIHGCILNNMKFNPTNDGTVYAASSDGTISCTDLETGISLSLLNLNPNGWQGPSSWRMLYGLDVNSEKGVVLVADNFGFLYLVDIRSNSKVGEAILIHKKGSKVVGLHCNPVQPDLLLSCGNDHFARIWDMRRLEAGSSLCSLAHRRVVNSAYFSPRSGSKILTTSQDNRLRVWDSIFGNLGSPSREIVHSHDFNRHLTPFRAEWDPKDPSESLVVIGRYISENYNGAALHPIDFIDISTGQLVAEVMEPNITTISPVNKLHPRDDVLATGSSRSIFIWRPKEKSEIVQQKDEKKIVVCGKAEKKLNKKFDGESDDSDDDICKIKGKNSKSRKAGPKSSRCSLKGKR